MKSYLVNPRKVGAKLESDALRFLQDRGYKCVSRNFNSRFGEIDLIVIDNTNTLVFVEVRYRRNLNFGLPAETVSYSKQVKLKKTANYFLSRNQPFNRFSCRFDVIGISQSGSSDQNSIEWIKNAFY